MFCILVAYLSKFKLGFFCRNSAKQACKYGGRQKKVSHHLNASVIKALITHLDFDVTEK
jgi:hypothetical protein